MIKKNGIRLTRRSKTYTKGLAYAIATYARVQMPPYYDGLHTGIKNARMRRNRTELAVLCRYVKNFEHRKYANSFLLSKHSCPIFFGISRILFPDRRSGHTGIDIFKPLANGLQTLLKSLLHASVARTG